MEYAGLYRKMEEKMADCRARYEKDKTDSFLSHVRGSELETLEALYGRIREEGLSRELWTYLKSRLAELEEAKKREEASPSFSWYGDHYHYLVLEGQCDACRSVIELLQEEKPYRE